MRENTVRYQQNQRLIAIALMALSCQVACAPTALRTASRHSVRPGGPADESELPDDEGGARRLPMGRRAALVDVDDAALNEIDDADDALRAPAPKPLTTSLKMASRCRAVQPIIERAARAGGEDPLLMLAIAWVESGFNPDAESPAGARGVMQLVPRTARVFGCNDPSESRCAAAAATSYFSRLKRMFDGETVYALCAYHSGHVAPQKAWRAGQLPANLSYATKVLEARARLERSGCDGK